MDIEQPELMPRVAGPPRVAAGLKLKVVPRV